MQELKVFKDTRPELRINDDGSAVEVFPDGRVVRVQQPTVFPEGRVGPVQEPTEVFPDDGRGMRVQEPTMKEMNHDVDECKAYHAVEQIYRSRQSNEFIRILFCSPFPTESQ